MTTKAEYKESLKGLDRNIRVCIKYLEGLLDEKFKLALKVKQLKQPQAPKVDLSRLESKLDSLQKQINGLRKKMDSVHTHVQEHDKSELSIKLLIKKAEQVLTEINGQFEELYHSGYYSEGTKRKIRDAGLIKRKKE